MKIKVVNRDNPELFTIYENVSAVRSTFNDSGAYCHQLLIGEDTATYPASEWKFYNLDFVEMF